MKHSHFENKNLATDPLSTINNDDGMTNVHFLENAVYKYMSGDRKPIAIRIDSGLYGRFKPLAKCVYGSVCRAAEVYMVSFILAVESGVHFSNTDRPINIGKIVIERNLRSRRKLEVTEEVTTTKKVKRRTVEVAPLDYDSLSVEDLQREYSLAKSARQYGRTMVLGALLKKRVDSNG